MAIEINLTGIGPRGDPGPQGPPGGTAAHVHLQDAPLDTWSITHGLDFYPSTTVVDSAGTVVEGEVSYPDPDTVIVRFSVAFAGAAYLS